MAVKDEAVVDARGYVYMYPCHWHGYPAYDVFAGDSTIAHSTVMGNAKASRSGMRNGVAPAFFVL